MERILGWYSLVLIMLLVIKQAIEILQSIIIDAEIKENILSLIQLTPIFIYLYISLF